MSDEEKNQSPPKKPEKPEKPKKPQRPEKPEKKKSIQPSESESESYHTPLGSGEDLRKYEKPRSSRRLDLPRVSIEMTPSIIGADSKKKKSTIRPLLDPTDSSSHSEQELSRSPSTDKGGRKKSKKQNDSSDDRNDLPRVSSQMPSYMYVHGHGGSAISYNPSIFGEGPMKYDDDTRRLTIAWPESGCIHIPLRPPGSDIGSADEEDVFVSTKSTDNENNEKKQKETE